MSNDLTNIRKYFKNTTYARRRNFMNLFIHKANSMYCNNVIETEQTSELLNTSRCPPNDSHGQVI